MLFLHSYSIPSVVFGVAVQFFRTDPVVSLAIDGNLDVLNENPKWKCVALASPEGGKAYCFFIWWLTHAPCCSDPRWCTRWRGIWRAPECPHRCRSSPAQGCQGSRSPPADGTKAQHLSIKALTHNVVTLDKNTHRNWFAVQNLPNAARLNLFIHFVISQSYDDIVQASTSMLSARSLMRVTCSARTGFRRRTFSLWSKRQRPWGKQQHRKTINGFKTELWLFSRVKSLLVLLGPHKKTNKCGAASMQNKTTSIQCKP